jgi:hypothetical protein
MAFRVSLVDVVITHHQRPAPFTACYATYRYRRPSAITSLFKLFHLLDSPPTEKPAGLEEISQNTSRPAS